MFFLGFKIGLGLLKKKMYKEALEYLFIPINYWRVAEYEAALKVIRKESFSRILDIGSPKLISIYLEMVTSSIIHATDIEDYFIIPFNAIKKFRKIPEKKYNIEIQDGRKLTYKSEFFDFVYSISVLEHIPYNGDTDCIKEIARVLTKGGKCFLTVPFSPEHEEIYTNKEIYWKDSSIVTEGKGTFFQRRYNKESLYERIIKPSGLKLKELKYIGEKIVFKSGKELFDYLPMRNGAIHVLLSKIFLTKPKKSWEMLKNPLCAVIVLEK